MAKGFVFEYVTFGTQYVDKFSVNVERKSFCLSNRALYEDDEAEKIRS